MVDLFLNRVLVENNWDQDELNTEREIVGILENRIMLLLFASVTCQRCQEFLPVLNNFFKRLKDPAYIEYPKLLALIFVRFGFISTPHTSMGPVSPPSHCYHSWEFRFCLLSPAWTNQRSSRKGFLKSCTGRFCFWPSMIRTGSRWTKKMDFVPFIITHAV